MQRISTRKRVLIALAGYCVLAVSSLVWTAALVLSASAQETKELRIAAASELNIAIEKLAAAFEKQTDIHVVASLESSPDLFAQLKSGALFDVFLSADKDFPAHLEEAGLAEPGTFELYGRGVIVLWWRNHGPVGLFPQDFKVLTGNLDVLKSAAVHKIAVVNPEHGPYGRAAVQVLQAYGIYDQVKSKLLLGEDVSEAAQFAQSGDAEIAFILGIWLSPRLCGRREILCTLSNLTIPQLTKRP